MEDDDKGQIIEQKSNEIETENKNHISKKSKKFSQKLITILNLMSIEFPLNNLSEKIESETGGRFTFKEFYKIVDKYYKKLSKKDKKNLLKYIPLYSLDITIEKPYISLFSIFNYFSNLLNTKIYSPSLILYEISNKIKNIYKKSTLEFFIDNNLQVSSKICLEDLINLFFKKLNINELITSIFYELINYNKKDKIKIEDIILTIDSYREDNYKDILNEKEKNILYLNIITDKYFIDMNKIFKETDNNCMNYDTIKKSIIKEINKNNKNYNSNEIIDENMLHNILLLLSRDENIYKEEYKKCLSEAKLKIKNRKIILNITQKYWINKYIDILSSFSISPKKLFKSISEENNSDKIELNEIKNKLINDISIGKINLNYLDNIIKSLDINNNGIIEYWQYEDCINQVLKKKEELNNIEYNNDQNEYINNISNMWLYGIRPNDYYLLPIKGNYNILEKVNKNIKEIISNIMKKEKEIKNIKSLKSVKSLDNLKSVGTLSSDLTNFKKGLNIMNNEEYNDEYFLKLSLVNFNFNNNTFPCFDLLDHLVEKEDFSTKYSYEIIRYLDSDNDGYINVIDLIKFLLHELKYKATKLVYKYLYIKIYKELNLKSCEDFFQKYNIKPSDIIEVNKLITFLQDLNIEIPLTKQIINELQILNKPPLIYEYLYHFIDGFKNDPYINNFFYTKDSPKSIDYNFNSFEKEVKRNINYFVDKEDNKGNLKDKLKNQLNKILEKCGDIMNYAKYKKYFSKPLHLNQFFSLILFQLLKTFSKNGEQIIYKNDLLIFFESYSVENDKINLNNLNGYNKKDIKEIIQYIENLGPPLKYALEIIPFRSNGIIPSSELIKYLYDFYNGSISKNYLMYIVFLIDIKKRGIINYEQIQLFLNKYCKEFSIKLEIQIIACNICKTNKFNAENYFNKFKNIIKNNNLINQQEHNIILHNICSNNKNREQLFNYLAKNGNNYCLNNLTDLLNGYFELDNNYKFNDILEKEEVSGDLFPDKDVVEKVMKTINLGKKGYISINEFIMRFKRNYRKKLLAKIDKNKKGFISFSEFIKNCIKIYGINIDLNYKLCAQYLFKKYIKNPNKIQKYLLDKTNLLNINSYLSYEKTYNYFMFAFCNNKFLFESFYLIYKEKRGKYMNMINLKSIEQFILVNNKDFIHTKINKNISDENINDILHKKMISIKDIINHLNVIQSGLEKNFLIKEKYFRSILKIKLNLIDKDINTICNLFKVDEESFDLKKFFLYENEDIKKYDIILHDEILPKIKNKISKSEYKSYKEYKLKVFNNIDYLDICQLYSKFNNLYGITLYNCLLLMKNEQFFSTEKFFTENNLKNEFQCKDYEPGLKLALSRLNDFFQKNNDKIKVFKDFDLDKNGKLSSEEFIIALNSFEDLNLNDSQKYKILNIIDINKDGKIDIQEFIKFINNTIVICIN